MFCYQIGSTTSYAIQQNSEWNIQSSLKNKDSKKKQKQDFRTSLLTGVWKYELYFEHQDTLLPL